MKAFVLFGEHCLSSEKGTTFVGLNKLAERGVLGTIVLLEGISPINQLLGNGQGHIRIRMVSNQEKSVGSFDPTPGTHSLDLSSIKDFTSQSKKLLKDTDIVFLHLVPKKGDEKKLIVTMDKFVQALSKLKNVFVVVVMGFSKEGESIFLKLKKKPTSEELELLESFSPPPQSYVTEGSKQMDIPLAVGYFLEGHTRKDENKEFSIENCVLRGGNLAIPASAFMKEIVYKLGKGVKFGA